MFATTKTSPFYTETIEVTAIECRHYEHDLNAPVAAQPQTPMTAPATTKKEERHGDLADLYGAWGRMVRERRRQRRQYLRTVIGSFLQDRYKLTGTARNASLTDEPIGDDTEQKEVLLLEELSIQ